MSNKVKDITAVTESVTFANTSDVIVPLITAGPTEAGSSARIIFWANGAYSSGAVTASVTFSVEQIG